MVDKIFSLFKYIFTFTFNMLDTYALNFSNGLHISLLDILFASICLIIVFAVISIFRHVFNK